MPFVQSSAKRKSKLTNGIRVYSTWAGFPQTLYSEHSIDIRTVKLFSFGKFDSFLAGLCRNQVYCACFSTQTSKKTQFNPVWQSRKQALRAYCPSIFILSFRVINYTAKRKKKLDFQLITYNNNKMLKTS